MECFDTCTLVCNWGEDVDDGAWRSIGDAENMWDKTTNCIRKVAREELSVLKCNFDRC